MLVATRGEEREGEGESEQEGELRASTAFLSPRRGGKQEVAAPAVRPVHGQKEKEKKRKKKGFLQITPWVFLQLLKL